jgi:ABC-type sugar transport system ATPase subunit
MSEQKVALRMEGISKSFPGVQALSEVDLEVRHGEIHALLGENGAGKSTLIMILAGIYRPDAGRIHLGDAEVEIAHALHAQQLGIGTVFQELSLCPNLTVAENVFAHRQPGRFAGFIHGGELRRRTDELLRPFGGHIAPDALVGDLSVANQQLVEIAKALSIQTRILVLDEPTSALSDEETRRLFDIMRRLKTSGVSMIFITHRIKEIFQIADRATVLRDGRKVETVNVEDVTAEKLISLMVGRELSHLYPEKAKERGETIFRVQDFARGRDFQDISFEVRRGEILGIAGLVGAGRTEIARAIFGIDRRDKGDIFLKGERIHIRSPQQAIRHGIGYMPEDRKTLGLFLQMSVSENVIAPVLRRFSRFGWMNSALVDSTTTDFVEKLRIRTPSISQQVINLSGGNQQKVLLAKWLAATPSVIIVDEPTRGVDVGAKAEIHALLRQIADRGVGVIMISSDLPEILGMSDRIIVIHDGRICGRLSGREATEEKVMACATGHAILNEMEG